MAWWSILAFPVLNRAACHYGFVEAHSKQSKVNRFCSSANQAIFNRVLRVIESVWFCLTSFSYCSKNWRHPCNQSDVKFHQLGNWLLAFSRARGGALVFKVSSYWLLTTVRRDSSRKLAPPFKPTRCKLKNKLWLRHSRVPALQAVCLFPF